MSAHHSGREGMGGPYASLSHLESQAPIIHTEQMEGAPYEIDIVLGNVHVRMHALGTLEHPSLEAYVEAYTHSLVRRYAIVANAATPYETAYVFMGPDTSREWALAALSHRAVEHIYTLARYLPMDYLGNLDEALQLAVAAHAGERLNLVLAGMNHHAVRAAADAIHLAIAQLGGESKHFLGKARIFGADVSAFYVDHAIIGNTGDAAEANIPPGLYALVQFTVNETTPLAYLTALRFTDKMGWVSAPFELRNAPNTPDPIIPPGYFPALQLLTEPHKAPRFSVIDAIRKLALPR